MKLSPKDLDALESQGCISTKQRHQIEGMLNKQHEAVRPLNAWDWVNVMSMVLIFVGIAVYLIAENTP